MSIRMAIYSAHQYEIPLFIEKKPQNFELTFISEGLDSHSVENLSATDIVCCFVTDQLSASLLQRLKEKQVKLIALRSTGFDHVDVATAHALDLPIIHVPGYSPQAVAEFAIGLMLMLSRNIFRAHERVRQHNFSLENLMGFNLQGKTIGIIGTGNIGSAMVKILSGFDANILAYDPSPNSLCEKWGAVYTSLENIWHQADIISLHCPLTPQTHHMINVDTLKKMQPHVMLINTGRGALIDSVALIAALKEGRIGSIELDVYENEKALFFADHSEEIIADDIFIRLQSFPNVLITGHQAFLSREAVGKIISVTLENVAQFFQGNIQKLPYI